MWFFLRYARSYLESFQFSAKILYLVLEHNNQLGLRDSILEEPPPLDVGGPLLAQPSQDTWMPLRFPHEVWSNINSLLSVAQSQRLN